MVRLDWFLAVVLCGATAQASPVEAVVTQPAPEGKPIDAGAQGFHLEGKPAIDDVFGDASDYRRTIDRFLELTNNMQSMRDEFARSVQTTLGELTKSKDATRPKKYCPVEAVAAPYARARHLGSEYLRVGRELTRHYEQVKEFDKLGESIGLTPDYRWKVRRVLQQYNSLLTDYREMKVAFHDQLDDELKYAGCDLQALLLKGDPQGKPLGAQEDWPTPGQPGAPGVAPPVQLIGHSVSGYPSQLNVYVEAHGFSVTGVAMQTTVTVGGLLEVSRHQWDGLRRPQYPVKSMQGQDSPIARP